MRWLKRTRSSPLISSVAVAATRRKLKAVMKARAFDVTVDLGLGRGEDTIFTCDFSLDYVKINADYTT